MDLITKEHFNNVVLKSKTPYIIDFYADWCGPCKMLSPILDDLSKDADFKEKLHFVKIDTEQYPEIAQDFAVQGIPCLIIIKDGKEISRIVGYAPKAVMKVKIKSIVDKL